VTLRIVSHKGQSKPKTGGKFLDLIIIPSGENGEKTENRRKRRLECCSAKGGSGPQKARDTEVPELSAKRGQAIS